MADDQEAAPQVRGITKADVQSWKHHPVSRFVLGYYEDKRAFIERAAIDQWISGKLSLQGDQTLRGQIIELIEAAEISFEGLQAFYSEENDFANGGEAT